MNQSMAQAIELAKTSVLGGTLLTAQANSPLEAMVKVVSGTQPNFSYVANNSGEDEQLNTIATFIETPLTDDIGDLNCGALVRDIGNAVVGHIDYIKNVIVPQYNDYVAKVQEYMETPDRLVSKFDIEIKDFPEIMKESGFQSLIDSEGNGLLANPEAIVKIPHDGPLFITNSLLTGESSYDDLIKQWAATVGDEFLVNAWESVYGTKGSDFMTLFTSGDNGLNYSLLTFLTSRRIYDEPPEGVVMSLTEYRKYISQYKDAATASLKNIYKRQETIDNSGMLVLSANLNNYKVQVNGNVYREFINDGGKNEVLFGSMISGNNSKTIAGIKEDADKFYKKYEEYEQIHATRRRLNADNIFRKALKIVFVDLLKNDLSIREIEAHATFGMNVETMANKVDEVIDGLTRKELTDVYDSCMKVLCRARFPYTDAEKYLTSMLLAGQANSALDSREAALPALIEVVADFVCAQIMKTRI